MDGPMMTTLSPPDPSQAMRQNLTDLGEYAKRVIVEGDDSLAPCAMLWTHRCRKSGKAARA